MSQNSPLGFANFIMQSDVVTLFLLFVLVLMSIGSWTIIAIKLWRNVLQRKESKLFLGLFWNASSLKDVEQNSIQPTVQPISPFKVLTSQAVLAKEHHEKFGATKLSEAGDAKEYLTRSIKQNLDEQTAQIENGLTFLATVGAVAPFVGLFGTVWGVYHALLNIGMTGSGSLDKIAGPVGEALIMTGLGLAVALPAVIAYNAFTRSNRVLLSRLDSFAFELLSFLTLGESLRQSTPENKNAKSAEILANQVGA